MKCDHDNARCGSTRIVDGRRIGECEQVFTCNVCGEVVGWDEGGDDNMPGACAACWFKAQPTQRVYL